MVIFGAAGDLTGRMLIPALYNLARAGLLSREFAVVGVARTQCRNEDFRKADYDDIKEYCGECVDDDLWEWFSRRFYYFAGDFGDDNLYAEAQRFSGQNRSGPLDASELFLLPGDALRATSVRSWRSWLPNGLMEQSNSHWRRVVIEKPFGHDLESAKALNQQLLKVADEKQIYRIDHYLGKETVQNIMAFRFANGIFEPVWNRRYIDHVQISVAETVGVEGRGSYFDHAGSLRDMVPNHIMQLISLTAMEPPISFDANAVRDEQAKILHAIQPMSDEEVLSRSARPVWRRNRRRQAGYGLSRGADVPPDSRTETFVAMKLFIDNWRWADVPFYLRTGKRMPVRNTHIVIQFRRAPFVLFRDTPVEHLMPNQLVLHIQPEEGISLQFAAKVPGPVMRLGTVDMNFEYQEYFGKQPSTGYERLLHDCMIGDQTLFQRADMVEAGWSVVNPVLDLWKALPPRNFPNYASGTWGPKEADELLERDGRRWRNFEK